MYCTYIQQGGDKGRVGTGNGRRVHRVVAGGAANAVPLHPPKQQGNGKGGRSDGVKHDTRGDVVTVLHDHGANPIQSGQTLPTSGPRAS